MVCYSYNIEQSYPIHRKSLNSVYNSHSTRCFSYCSLKFSIPQPQNLWKCSHDLWPSFSYKQQFSNEKIWCLETKLSLKVIFSQRIQGPDIPRDMQKHVWFVHVTDYYYSGKRNLNKFFLTTKFLLFKVTPYRWGNFEQLWWSLFDRNACTMNWLFLHLEKRGCSGLSVILEPCDYGNQFYLEKTLKKNCSVDDMPTPHNSDHAANQCQRGWALSNKTFGISKPHLGWSNKHCNRH